MGDTGCVTTNPADEMSPVPSQLLLCLSSLGGQGMGSTFCSVCVCRETQLSARFLSSQFLHPVCRVQSWRAQIKTLICSWGLALVASMRFSRGGKPRDVG